MVAERIPDNELIEEMHRRGLLRTLNVRQGVANDGMGDDSAASVWGTRNVFNAAGSFLADAYIARELPLPDTKYHVEDDETPSRFATKWFELTLSVLIKR